MKVEHGISLILLYTMPRSQGELEETCECSGVGFFFVLFYCFCFCFLFGGWGVSHNSQLLHESHLTILTIRYTHKISTRTERITVQGDIEAMFTHVGVPKK